LQISQPREPCWKLAERFQMPDMIRRVRDSGRSGWYCRVLEPGEFGAGDAIVLKERPCPDWPIRRMQALRANPSPSSDELHSALRLPLPEGWLRRFQKRLDRMAT
jgi:MOSC domain-containing protein YiiM